MTGKKVLRTYEGSWSTKYMQRSPEIHISMIVTVGTFANLKNYYTFGIVLGYHQGRNERGEGGTMPRAPKSLNNVASTFFNTEHLLPKDLSLENRGAKLASWPGHHLTPVRSWVSQRILNICRKTNNI